MDFLNPIFLDGLRAGELRMALPPSRPLQYVSVRDIGRFAAAIVDRGAEVFGRRFEIASDERTGEETAKVLGRAIGRHIRYVDFPPAAARTQQGYRRDVRMARCGWLRGRPSGTAASIS
jgi:uncharacterized protein YbjT (DUF2867 family)